MKTLIGSGKSIGGAILFVGLAVCMTLKSAAIVTVSAGDDKDTSVSAYIQKYLDHKSALRLYFPSSVGRIYAANNAQPVWITEKSDHKQSWQAMMLLDCVLQYGLFRADYHPNELLYDPLHDMLDEPHKVSNSRKAKFDILLTDAMIALINNLHYGKLNPVYSADRIDRGGKLPFKADDALISALQQNDFRLAVLRAQPQNKQYAAMQDRLRQLEGVYRGDCYAIPEEDVRKIAINMERLRWADIDGAPFLQINIPAFTLKFYLPDTVYTFKTVVGKVSAPTPSSLNSEITYLTTLPEWKIPHKIFVREVLPKALKYPSYIEDSHFSIYDKNGNYISPSRKNLLQIRRNPDFYSAKQSNGCDNALGLIVFRFQNPYDIYLHDTPEQQLFKRDVRAFSHSCIRVENAQQLAELVLTASGTESQIPLLRKAVKDQVTRNISFKRPMPIRITYLTCEINKGEMVTYKDIYDLDKRLEMALYESTETLATE
ncbi:MAG: L,D-transpeptidase family protein [Bacteroidetes bacterium]|nr:L,D-transpeptidase family protein [Bacteroidota bacterium]